MTMDYEAWRCTHDSKKFCPPEGCPKHLGCARDHGWKQGNETPSEYRSVPATSTTHNLVESDQ